jgi:LL-diaminopimelate aminotransferase
MAIRVVDEADRITNLPPYLFAEIDRMKRGAIDRGVDIINLGVGDPDQPTPAHIIEKLYEAAKDPKNHRYPSYEGLLEFRRAAAASYQQMGVELNPETEVLSLIGSKEGIGHIVLAFVNPGDFVLMPDPGYPVYRAGTIFAGGIPYMMPLNRDNDFLPRLEDIDPQVAARARLMFINYPNNPTAAVGSKEFFAQVVDFAKEHNIIVCHDAAYSRLVYDGGEPLSFMQVEGAKDVGIEFGSLSKTYNMTGWRVGFAVGNAEVLAGLGRIKTNLDSGIFQAVQYAGIAALTGPQDCVTRMIETYQRRRDVLVDGLNSLAGWEVPKPKATFYVWAPVPAGYSSADMTKMLLQEAGIVTTPGNGFGTNGEGYIRISLTCSEEKLEEAVGRIQKLRL